MESRKLDSLIQETLEDGASNITMSSDLQKQIKQEVRNKSKEEYKMKRFSMKKVILLAAALCLMVSMAAVAGGKVTGWVTSSNPSEPDMVSFAELEKAEAKMGHSIQAIEAFSNGFQFKQGSIKEVNELDDSGVVMGTFPEITLDYSKGSSLISYYIYPLEKATGDEKHKTVVSIPYGDYTLIYTADTYKFVPPDYEVTQEETDLMEAGQLYISYGSSKVEVEEIINIGWADADLHYSLMSFGDTAMTQDQLVAMAKEIIDAE